MIQQTTFVFKAERGKMLPWEALTHYGQTVKVILSAEKGFQRVQSSAYAYARKHGNRRLKLILRAQTFVIYELVPGDTDEDKARIKEELAAERKARAKLRLDDKRRKAWDYLTKKLNINKIGT